MSRDSWVVLSSANGSTNLGDESMWEATVQVLRDIEGPVRIISDSHPGFVSPISDVVLLPFLHESFRRGWSWLPSQLERAISFPRRTERAFDVAAQLYKRPRGELANRWLEEISGAKGVIVSGAGAMTDDYAPHGVAAWWLATEWARDNGVPVHFLGQGIGPLVDDRTRRYASRMLRLATTINVREDISAEAVRDLGVRTPVSVTPDWAILNAPNTADHTTAATLVDDWFGNNSFVALSLHRRHNTTRKSLDEVSRLTEGLVRLARHQGLGVAFVPNMTGVSYSDDRETFDILSRHWETPLRDHVRVVRERVGPRVTRAILSRSQALFTTRYHPMIFALAERTPTVGLSYDSYYDQKLSGASAMFKVFDNVFRVSEVAPEIVLQASEFAPPEEAQSLGLQSVEVLAGALRGRPSVNDGPPYSGS